MTYCKRCGEEIDDNVRYCPTCGEDQTGPVKQEPVRKTDETATAIVGGIAGFIIPIVGGVLGAVWLASGKRTSGIASLIGGAIGFLYWSGILL